jgi:hypothetical protein
MSGCVTTLSAGVAVGSCETTGCARNRKPELARTTKVAIVIRRLTEFP